VEGQLQVYENVGLVHYRPAKADPKKKPTALNTWLEHLALQMADWSGPKTSYLIGEDGSWTFPEMPDTGRAKDLLAQLLDLYWQGLRQPLPFFPRTSLAYTDAPTDKALERALSVWEGAPDSGYQEGEKEDPYFRLCFANHTDPLDAKFQDLAKQVCEPLLDSHEKEKE
jgi:exodeoxyribonuclease V gamma subunit